MMAPAKATTQAAGRLNRGQEKAELATTLPTRELTAAELRKAYERLRTLDESRKQLLSTVSHELASPVTTAQLQLEMLRSPELGPLTPAQSHSVDVAYRALSSLSDLVKDLLDAARFQNGRLPLERSQMSLDDVLQEVADEMEAQAREAQIQLIMGSSGGVRLDADRTRIMQVLRNLVGNGIKFGVPGGRVWVDVAQRPGYVEVSVRDTGIGIRTEDFPLLFQPFSRLQPPDGRGNPGTGLGLYISLGIVEQHGGRLWVDSDGAGKGATFTFTLPVSQTGVALMPPYAPIAALGFWPLVYFRCPTCGTRDIDMKILRNKYECNGCAFTWR